MGGIGAQAHLFKKTFRDLAFSDIFTDETNPLVIPLVVFGHPGTARPDDVVCFQGLRSKAAPAAMGPTRPREEVIELDVLISVARGGEQEAEEQCSDAAYGYLSQLEEFVRSVDTSVGGTVKYCFLDHHESDGWTVGGPNPGRNITIDATFEAHYRITSN